MGLFKNIFGAGKTSNSHPNNGITVYKGSFTKQDGSLRTMRYVPFDTLVNRQIMSPRASSRNLKEGQELVWDVENREIRIFNRSTLQGSISTESPIPVDEFKTRYMG